jgi:hypothetical protein
MNSCFKITVWVWFTGILQGTKLFFADDGMIQISDFSYDNLFNQEGEERFQAFEEGILHQLQISRHLHEFFLRLWLVPHVRKADTLERFHHFSPQYFKDDNAQIWNN